MIHAFNTGNKYSKYGQRIAFVEDGEKVTFLDYDRDIAGTVPLKPLYRVYTEPTVTDVIAHLIRAYNRYEYQPESAGKVARDNPELVEAAKAAR